MKKIIVFPSIFLTILLAGSNFVIESPLSEPHTSLCLEGEVLLPYSSYTTFDHSVNGYNDSTTCTIEGIRESIQVTGDYVDANGTNRRVVLAQKIESCFKDDGSWGNAGTFGVLLKESVYHCSAESTKKTPPVCEDPYIVNPVDGELPPCVFPCKPNERWEVTELLGHTDSCFPICPVLDKYTPYFDRKYAVVTDVVEDLIPGDRSICETPLGIDEKTCKSHSDQYYWFCPSYEDTLIYPLLVALATPLPNKCSCVAKDSGPIIPSNAAKSSLGKVFKPVVDDILVNGYDELKKIPYFNYPRLPHPTVPTRSAGAEKSLMNDWLNYIQNDPKAPRNFSPTPTRPELHSIDHTKPYQKHFDYVDTEISVDTVTGVKKFVPKFDYKDTPGKSSVITADSYADKIANNPNIPNIEKTYPNVEFENPSPALYESSYQTATKTRFNIPPVSEPVPVGSLVPLKASTPTSVAGTGTRVTSYDSVVVSSEDNALGGVTTLYRIPSSGSGVPVYNISVESKEDGSLTTTVKTVTDLKLSNGKTTSFKNSYSYSNGTSPVSTYVPSSSMVGSDGVTVSNPSPTPYNPTNPSLLDTSTSTTNSSTSSETSRPMNWEELFNYRKGEFETPLEELQNAQDEGLKYLKSVASNFDKLKILFDDTFRKYKNKPDVTMRSGQCSIVLDSFGVKKVLNPCSLVAPFKAFITSVLITFGTFGIIIFSL